ncbi:EAL domain-containing protein [Biostraticola tofi]|uniref:EAL domain-containing protein n=1 Tax=Biostraticola tofi TaxID=466109 RepID=UPI001050C606|nr:EAL domain-containing protein [Biostraticola tofi]
MRIRRSLTIKQMTIVSGVALVTICIFIVIQLFHFVQQRRDDYAQQLQNVAQSVRLPLSNAVLKADIPEAERILLTLKPVGILSRAQVVLPNNFQVLHTDFPPERPVPSFIQRTFGLPIEVTVPLYSLPRPSNSQALAYLVLQVDSYRMFQFIISLISTMVSTYLLLALIMTVAITWCINRLMVHPLRAIARELETLTADEVIGHQLSLPNIHRDDELGVMVRSYNRNQQVMAGTHQHLSQLSSQARLHQPQPTEQARRRQSLENTVLTGIAQGRCALFFQPQLDIRDKRLIGAEGLLRWRHEDGSYSLPADFITDAEQNGVMVPLGNWVLEASCKVLASWRQRGITLPLAVNISAKQLQETNLLPHLKLLMERYQVRPSQLMLEITETARIDELDKSLSLLRQLRELGVLVALDDFGMGYASLSFLNRLRTLPVDLLKIDRSFIESLPEDPVMLRIVSAIARVLELPVIAEGIENQAQLDFLLSQDICWGQGYLFAEPLPQTEFEQRFLSNLPVNAAESKNRH